MADGSRSLPSFRFRLGDQGCKWNSHRLSNGICGIQAWIAQAALDLPDVRLMKPGLLRKNLFAQILGFPVSLQDQGEGI